MLNIWEYEIKKKEELCVVIPVIFYHGKEKWEVRGEKKKKEEREKKKRKI